MKTTRELLGARIKEIRKRRGITQDQLAERVDLATRYISLIEVGRSSPSLEAIENIARVLEVELKELFDFGHLDPMMTAPEELLRGIGELDEGKRQLIYLLVKAMVNQK